MNEKEDGWKQLRAIFQKMKLISKLFESIIMKIKKKNMKIRMKKKKKMNKKTNTSKKYYKYSKILTKIMIIIK